jgi:3-oxoacyl-[acyl-carrier protein] reductase
VAVAIEGLLSPFSDHMTGLNILHDGGFTRAY